MGAELLSDVTVHALQTRVEALERELHSARIHLRNILVVLEKFLEIRDPHLLTLVASDSQLGEARSFLNGDHK
jgi:hypothetical protein